MSSFVVKTLWFAVVKNVTWSNTILCWF